MQFILARILLLSIILSYSYSLNAQGFNISGGVGYNLSLASQNLMANANVSIKQTSTSVVRGSLAKGPTAFILCGYGKSSLFSYEAGAFYTQGASYSARY